MESWYFINPFFVVLFYSILKGVGIFIKHMGIKLGVLMGKRTGFFHVKRQGVRLPVRMVMAPSIPVTCCGLSYFHSSISSVLLHRLLNV